MSGVTRQSIRKAMNTDPFRQWKDDVIHRLREAGFSSADIFYAIKHLEGFDCFTRGETAADFAQRAITLKRQGSH
jgi:hypothetical protein